MDKNEKINNQGKKEVNNNTHQTMTVMLMTFAFLVIIIGVFVGAYKLGVTTAKKDNNNTTTPAQEQVDTNQNNEAKKLYPEFNIM